MTDEASFLHGWVVAELRGPDGELKGRCESPNLITNVGDQMYGERGAAPSGVTPPAAPIGMRLGTGASSGGSAPAKSGANSTLTAFLSGSSQAFDASYPQSALTTGRQITYKVTSAAGTATTASAITEAVITNDAVATAWTGGGAGVQANTISRVALTGIGSKGASDTLTITWTHTLTGA
jgi:hypothetical protein